MPEKNLFEIASREKYRFPYRGMISTEDLWDLPVEKLDQIFKELNEVLRRTEEESLLTEKTKENESLRNKVAIIRYIVAFKMEEKEKAKKAVENRQKKQQILNIISRKQDEKLQNMTEEQLMAMLDELDKQ